MSEMEWEGAPEVHTPLVRPWFWREVASWHRACWPRENVFVWGFFFWVWAIWQFVKLVVYVLGLGVMVAAYPFWFIAELITYRHRVKRDALRAWGPYVREQVDHPPEAA